MIKKSIFKSMTAKIIYFICIVGLICAGVYFGGVNLSQSYIKNVVMSKENTTLRNRAVWREFSEFVGKNQISTSDSDKIFEWIREHRNVYISIYSNNYLIISANGLNSQAYEPENRLTLKEVDGMGIEVYPIRFKDGSFMAYTCDTSAKNALEAAPIIWLAAALFMFSVCVVIYTQHVTRRVIRLSRQTEAITREDLSSEITVKGGDELSILAGDIDGMRNDLIEKIREEQQARRANNELLTNLSHDVRTPLTVLIGYCELMGKEEGEKKLREYARAAGAQAAQLGALMDKLFGYFCIYGDKRPNMDVKSYDAQLLLEQMLFEKQFRLECEGFSTKLEISAQGERMSTDAVYLNRAVDNLMSNIEKYADGDKPVVLSARAACGELCLTIENAVKRKKDEVKSTGIGMRSSERIIEQLGGSMRVKADESVYAVTIILPLE